MTTYVVPQCCKCQLVSVLVRKFTQIDKWIDGALVTV